MFSRTYHGLSGMVDEVDSYFAGFNANIRVSPPMRLILGAEVPFNLTGSSFVNIPEDLMFKAFAGFSYKFK